MKVFSINLNYPIIGLNIGLAAADLVKSGYSSLAISALCGWVVALIYLYRSEE